MVIAKEKAKTKAKMMMVMMMLMMLMMNTASKILKVIGFESLRALRVAASRLRLTIS